MRALKEESPRGCARGEGKTKVPSEKMRTRAREWLYNADHPNEAASQQEVDDLATLLDDVRAEFGEEAAKHIEGYRDRYLKVAGKCEAAHVVYLVCTTHAETFRLMGGPVSSTSPK
jgi:hypothetical protein